MVPGIAAYSNKAKAKDESLGLKCLTSFKYVGTQFITPYLTRYTKIFAIAIYHKYLLFKTYLNNISFPDNSFSLSST